MKAIVFSLMMFGAFNFLQAQQNGGGQGQSGTPEERATKHSQELTKELGLSQQQEQQVYQAILTKENSIKQVRAQNSGGDKEQMHTQMKPIKEQFNQTMKGILTADQFQKWEQIREENKEKHHGSH